MRRFTVVAVLCLSVLGIGVPASAYDLNEFRVQGNVFNVTVYKGFVGAVLTPFETYVNVAAFTSPWDAFTVQTLCQPGADSDCDNVNALLRCNPTEQFIQAPGDTPPAGFYLYSCPNTQVDNGVCVLVTGKMYATPSGPIPPGTSDILELKHLIPMADGYCTPK